MKIEKKFTDLIRDCSEISEYPLHTEKLPISSFSPAGKILSFTRDDMNGLFWFYECDNFCMDIHQFQIKEECFSRSPENLSEYGQIFSTYIVKGSGETFSPYQKLGADSIYTTTTNTCSINYLLHKNTPFVCVEICFKKPFLKKYIDFDIDQLNSMFISTEKDITKEIGKIATDIMECTMNSPAADIFFEAKAVEWLSIIMDAYAKKKKKLPLKDNEALSNVARYIENHYAMTISQKTLENISMMSGTRLKTSFKEKYGMTITEFTQRQRIGVAEILLTNTTLSVGDIAKAVGYKSQSRFSQIFKRYCHCRPCDLRKRLK